MNTLLDIKQHWAYFVRGDNWGRIARYSIFWPTVRTCPYFIFKKPFPSMQLLYLLKHLCVPTYRRIILIYRLYFQGKCLPYIFV